MLCGVATCHVKFSPLSRGKLRATVVWALQFTRCFCKSLRIVFLLKLSFRRPCCCKLSTTIPTWPAFKPRRWAASLQAARNRFSWWPWFSSWDIERNNLNQIYETHRYFFDGRATCFQIVLVQARCFCKFCPFGLLYFRTCLFRHLFPDDVFSDGLFGFCLFRHCLFRLSFQTMYFQTLSFQTAFTFRILSLQTMSFQTLSFQTAFSDFVFSDNVISDYDYDLSLGKILFSRRKVSRRIA